MFIEFNNATTDGNKISLDIREIEGFRDCRDGEETHVYLYMKSDQIHVVDETYRSVKTKINNALKRIAKGTQGDSETEIETT